VTKRRIPPRSRLQGGFSLIELMIVVGIIGMLAGLAVPAYQDFTTRSRVVEGAAAASALRASIADFYMTWATLPANNASAGMGTAASYATNYVQSITVSNGIITVSFNALGVGVTAGDAIAWVPSPTSVGALNWDCSGAGTTMARTYRPAICR